MTKESLINSFEEKHKQLELALQGDDIEYIRKLSLDVHAMIHPAEISGRTEQTIADYVLDYMMEGHQNDLVPRENWEEDLHYAGTNTVPMCWQFWHTYRIEDLVSNILMANQNQLFDHEWQKKLEQILRIQGMPWSWRKQSSRGFTRIHDCCWKKYATNSGESYIGTD